MVSKAQQRATNKYNQKCYDQIVIRVPKGKKELYVNAVKAKGKSMAGFICEKLEELL